MGELELQPDEYAGKAWVSTGSASTGWADEGFDVEVDLRGHFEPLDGRFHWYGRIATSDELSANLRSGQVVMLRTPGGSAQGRLSDVDPWGRFRIAGTGRPPF